MGNVLRAYSLAFAGLLAFATSLGLGSLPMLTPTRSEWALVQAYQNNPSLNAQRASLLRDRRKCAASFVGLSPEAQASPPPAATIIRTRTSVFPLGERQPGTSSIRAELLFAHDRGQRHLHSCSTASRRRNRTRQAESQKWMAAREILRVTEQQVLLDAATAYMNLLRDQAVLDLQRRNVEVLTEQLKQTRDRFNVGEVTRTDVAQAESRLAAGRSQLLAAQSQYVTSRANYRRVIGVDPGTLAAGTPVDWLSPNVLARAIAQGQAQSPLLLAAWPMATTLPSSPSRSAKERSIRTSR